MVMWGVAVTARCGMLSLAGRGQLSQGGLGLFRYGRIWLGMMGRGGQGGVGFDVLRRGEAVKARLVGSSWVTVGRGGQG